ncbi:purine-cytosine permease fcyB [Echria macrotheca]|uniref:Purine-cytosine permease fcyB n=1 Tax=Echria macrotheca TaxID=438768 RepID=A0AAJ0F8R6_9PEZI|nr:purine-cytosine permease fcyB [Echria macrotheca]
MSSFGNSPRSGAESPEDIEKQQQSGAAEISTRGRKEKYSFGADLLSRLAVKDGEVYEIHPEKHPRWYQRLLDAGVEENGIKPVPLEHRTNTNYSNLFTVFFTCLLNLLPLPTGLLATLTFGMSLRDAALVILFFAMLTCIPPAFMGLGGMETGLRQLVQARYSFGRYLVTIPLLLNAATVTGFCLLSAVVGGQSLAAINPENVSVSVGIVITCLVSFAVSLLGFRAVHFYERWSWIPNLVSLVIAVGCGGRYLHLQTDAPPATVSQVFSYGCLIAGYFITFGGTSSDYTVYHNPTGVSKVKVFFYMYFGFLIPSVPLLILGAAIGGAVANVPSWDAAYQVTGIGGVMSEMLAPVGGFGKFILVLLALSVCGNISISVYSISLCLQMLVPPFAKVPRFVFILVTVAILIPCSIKAAEEWEESLTNFLALIGYWAGCFDAVIITELVVFRRMDYSTFDHAIWNVGRKLPPGIAAMGAAVCSMGLVIPGMAAPWYTGPIAEKTGDIGFEMAFIVTAICYLPFRWIEIQVRRRL